MKFDKLEGAGKSFIEGLIGIEEFERLLRI
jgi:hypothetical protein